MAARKTTRNQGKKRTSARQTTSRARQAAPRPEMNEKWSILLFGVGTLLFALTYVPGASAWSWLRSNVLYGVFGISTYLLAPLVVYAAVLVAMGQPVRSKAGKALLVMALLCGTYLVFSKTDLTDMTFAQGMRLLHQSGMSKWGLGGGALSALFGWSLLRLCGRTAARIILVLLMIVAVMFFKGVTPAHIYSFFEKRAGGLKQAAGERAQERAALRAERAAQRAAEEQEQLAAEPVRPDPVAFDVARSAEQARVAEQLRAEEPRGERPFFDIDLGPEPARVTDTHDVRRVDIGPGGTFGMNAAAHSAIDIPLEGPVDIAPEVPEAPPTHVGPFSVPGSIATTQSASSADAFVPSGVPDVAVTGHPAAQPAVSPQDDVPDLTSIVSRAAGVRPVAAEEPAAPEQEKKSSSGYVYPPLSLFEKQKPVNEQNVQEELTHNADLLVKTLSSFGVQTRILNISRGPSVTRYELQPLAGVKISRITGLADDIALNLAATGVRIEAPIPGKAAVGVEVPNKHSASVNIRTILESPEFTQSTGVLTMALGQDIAGKNWTWDLAKMPHVLIAGSTGSGKSVCINAIIMSFLYRTSPEDLKLIMIDPKMVELSDYNGIPHLLMPVVTEPRKAAGALGAAVAEMEKRYHEFAEKGVRNIEAYNKMAAGDDSMEKMPYMAIIIDELADLMMVAGKEVEDYICRIAQKARAAGMHLIVATQRPSVDVITGLIKANIPSRIAFAVSSQIDSRTILDSAGAEKLLGKGDMLFMPVGASKPTRIQGTFVHDEEIRDVQDFIKKHTEAAYDDAMIAEMDKCAAAEKGGAQGADSEDSDSRDSMFDTAVEVVLDAGQASTSFLQRRCKLGYSRAARLIDEMEQMHIIGPADGSKPRQVLISRQQWIEMQMQQASDATPDVV